MTDTPRILVLTARASDEEVIREQLGDEYRDVHACSEPSRFASAFETHRPQILIVGLRRVAESEQQLSSILSRAGVVAPFKALLLCDKEEVQRAYALCQDGRFDDYVLFWPMVHDARRLAMSVRQALRTLDTARVTSALPQANVHGRRLSTLGDTLEREHSITDLAMEQARRAFERAGSEIRSALDQFGEQIANTGLDDSVMVRDRARVLAELERFGRNAIQPPLTRAIDATRPLEQRLAATRTGLAPQLEAAKALGERAMASTPLLLVIDDDEFIRKVLERLLTSAGYAVEGLGSGADVVMFLRRCQPDLILMDVQLPDVDGITLTRQLKSIDSYAAIPIVMLTGQGQTNVVVESRNAGAVDFVVKPFDRATLLRKVAAQLGLP